MKRFSHLLIAAAATISPTALAQSGGGGFGGPSVLGRALGAGGPRTPDVRIKYFASVQGAYDGGLSVPLRTSQEDLNAAYGAELSAGIQGKKTWRRSAVVFNYEGGYRQYTNNSFLTGSSQNLNVGVSHTLGRRWQFTSSGSAGSINRAVPFGFGSGFNTANAALDSGLALNPAAEVFDIRVNFASIQKTLTYAPTPRLSVAFGGGANVAERSGNLFSSFGTVARGDVAYRLSRTQTISAAYSFFQFNFRGQYGNSVVQTVDLGYGLQLGRSYTLNLQLGGTQVQSEGVERVTLAPEIQELLGEQFGTSAFYRVVNLPSITAALTRNFRKSTVIGSYTRGVSPGNGLILTARTTNYSVSYSYRGFRNLGINANMSYLMNDMLLRFVGRTRNVTFGGRASYRITRALHFTATLAYRDQQTSFGSNQTRSGPRATVGLAFSPGEQPLSLW
jgi:hypothetical protein